MGEKAIEAPSFVNKMINAMVPSGADAQANPHKKFNKKAINRMFRKVRAERARKGPRILKDKVDQQRRKVKKHSERSAVRHQLAKIRHDQAKPVSTKNK